jgi:hypothetical protein
MKSKSKYYYTKLDTNSQSVYNSILSAWEAHNPNPSFKMNVSGGDMQKILEYIRYDNPGLFYVDFRSISLSTSASSATLKSSFLYKEKQIADMEKQFAAIVNGILLSQGFNAMDKYNKELVLHDYLVKNVSYVYGGDISEVTSITGAFILRRAVCEGYAKAFKLLCDLAGLSCLFVPGKATPLNKPEESHSWNIVKLDGICSHVDVTWDSTNLGSNAFNYEYVNLTDDEMSKDHIWDRSLLPACVSSQNNYYVKSGLCANGRSEFKSCVAAQAKQGKKAISLKINGKKATDELIMSLTQEALQGIVSPIPRMGLRYNQNRGTVLINLI